MWRALLAGVLVIMAISCKFEYRGDGDFVDRGPSAPVDRYVLDLGKVQPGVSEYAMGALPKAEFVLGLQISELPPEQAQSDTAAVAEPVEVSLVDAFGGTVLHQSISFRDWVWTCGVGDCGNAFAYLRDLREESGAAGTYFVPRNRQPYRLQVKIPLVDFFETHEVHLMASSGGWK